MIREVHRRGLDGKVYLWSDDNLSTDFIWRYLAEEDRELLASYPYYGRVCCFKGIDPASFSFNTRADMELYDRQFALMERLLELGLDLYAYVTLTGPSRRSIRDDIKRFIDKLQDLNENLPLRTVPLQIIEFSPVTPRVEPAHSQALRDQVAAMEFWHLELENRFTSQIRSLPITDVPLLR